MTSNLSYSGDMPIGRPSDRPRPPFGERLHQIREQAGLSQQQVAAALEISPRAYAFWERKPVALKAEQLAALADILGVSADLLLGRTEAKPAPAGPGGKMRHLFEAASRLSRSQQQKITAILEPYVREHIGGKAA